MLQPGMKCQLTLERSVGTVSEDGSPDSTECVMCSDCFDRTENPRHTLAEFPALAGVEATVFELETEEDLYLVSKLLESSLDREEFQDEWNRPIVCSDCGNTVGWVTCTQIEE